MASEIPSLCANGCGFFGSSSTKNLCSKCYNDILKQQIMADSAKIMMPLVQDDVTISHATIESIVTGVSALNFNDHQPNKKTAIKKHRCESCNKKVGLLGFDCRCGGLFCGAHRHAEKHSCPFDFKNFGRHVLATKNQLCVADKQESRI